MDLYQSFLERFHQAISSRENRSFLTNILQNTQSLEYISIEHLDSVVSSIFDRSNGLLYFIKNSLDEIANKNNPDKTLDTTLKESFNFLNFCITNFSKTSDFIQYILQIKDVCQQALTIKCNLYIKRAACDAFTKLIELFEDHDLKLDEAADSLIKLFNRIDRKERGYIFCILGKIIEHNIIGPLLQKHLNNIFMQLCSDAAEEFEVLNKNKKDKKTGTQTDKKTDFYIYFKVFVVILKHIKPDQKKLSSFYKYIKYYSEPKTNKRDNEARNCAINLLSCYINWFQDLLYPDCKYWYDKIRHLSDQTINYNNNGQNMLRAIYRIIGKILTNKNEEDTKAILLYFLDDFEKEFQNTNLNLITLRLLVYGYSQMAEPCKKHLDQLKIRRMYSTITALSLCFSEQSDSAYVENVCCYQEVLSDILCYMSDITIEQINVLVQLSVYTIKRFPDLIESKNPLAVSALIRTINNLGIINRNLLQRYLDSIIYDGIAWSCSHMLAVDAELQWELNNLRQRPVCYKNYLPLWTALLDAHKYRSGEREQLTQYVANTLMDICITLIDRLDIHVEEAKENVVHSDVTSAQNQADFHVFTNLVDLYVDVIDASESSLFANTVQRFLYEIIRLSYKHPLVSGFYKLARVGMKIVVTLENEEESGELHQAKVFLSSYLTYTLDLFPAFSNELLIAYLHLILNAPLAYIKDSLPRMLPVFKIAFTVGLSNLELAYTALDTLEMWTMSQKSEQKEHTNELLHEVVAYLEPYLRSTESSAEISQDLTTGTARKYVKRVHVIDTECTLRNFQRRVLLFFGSLNHDLLSNFVHERASRNIEASWDNKKCLKYSLPLPDARPDIYFDRALPRIIALARDSSDRRTKIAACEVLYSMMMLVIGNTTRHLDPDNSFITLYGVLCPTMLALGCDFDEAVRNLFEPLTLQFIHWLSSKSLVTLPVISYLLDSLFDGLTDDSNPALRDFSGKCLGEFTFWLLEKTDSRMRSNVHQIVQRIIQRINHLALLPSARKRVAAAVAFNNLYRILRQCEEIVSIYWLEIFYCFVRSSDGCDDLSITNALTHVERVMKEKPDIFLNNESGRRKPPEFDDATLIHALYWLLSQCGALDERYRSKCMTLYINVSKYNDNCAQETTRGFITTYGIERLNDIVLGDLKLYNEDVSAIDNPIPLLKVLDCYVWLIKKPIENPSIEKQLLSAEELFSVIDAGEHPIFSHIRNFVQQFWKIIAESSMETSAMKSRELQKLQMLRCRTLMAALDFIQELLNVNVLPESLWAEEALFALMIKCIMHPRAVGFDVRNIEMTNKLPRVLEILLNSMRFKFGNALPNTFKTHLSHFAQKYLMGLFNLHYIMQNDSCDEMIQHIKGLILLKRCNVFDRTISKMSALKNGEDTIVQIFQFLVSECMDGKTCSDLSMQMIEYLNLLMEFQFSQLSLTLESPITVIPEDTRSMIETLVKLISDDTPIIGLDSASITHGEHFLNTFRSVIFKYMLANTNAITIVFDKMSRDNPSFLLKWIEDLLLFLKRHRRELKDHVDTTVKTILQQFTCLQCTVGEIDSRRERLMNIYGVAVRLKSEIAREFPKLREWVLHQLIGNGDLEYKMRILRNFFICLTDAPDCDDKNLSGILRTLRTDEAAKQVSCFEILLTLLSSTKSIITLKFAIHFAAGSGARLFDEKLKEHLRKYYHRASSEYTLRSLEMTYHEFMNMETKDGMERLDILRGFLLPPFEFCDAVAIEHFFKKNVVKLNEIIKESIDDKCDDVPMKRSLLSKIGCFQLIATILGRAQNVLDKMTTGKELYNSLLENVMKTWNVRITRCKELARLMHCSAYNCSLTLISMSENENQYSIPFSKLPNGSFFIWKIIVDCDKRYKLGQTFKEYPKIRETIVNVKFADNERSKRVHRNSSVATLDLSACTLSEDINAYDFNRCVVLPYDSCHLAPQSSSQNVTSVALESDDFNEHECMPYICALLRRARQISGSCDKSPYWLKHFLDAMMIKKPNIKLFLLKIISNTADVFKYYAKFALTLIMRSAATYLKDYNLNYIITDILEILMDIEIVPSDANDKIQAQQLFWRFVDKVMTKKSEMAYVNDYNLRLMSNMVKKWRDCLTVPIEFIQKMQSAPEAAVHLILAFFENGITEEVIVGENIVNFLLKFLTDKENETKKYTMSLNCSKCLGLYLKLMDKIVDNESERESRRRDLSTRISSSLSFQSHLTERVKCIAALCQFYPEAAAGYITIAIDAMAKRIETSDCLEIFRMAMPQLSAKDVVDHLRHMKLQQMLKNRINCEKLVLRVVHDLVTILLPVDLLPYVNRAIPYIKDDCTESRELVYDIFMNVYKKYLTYIAVDDDVTVQTLQSVSVQNLLAGLLDPSRDLQEKILRFWAEETDLSTQKSKDRLLALLNMHLQTSEDVFALFVALLMLQLSTKSTEYNKKIFDGPLHSNSTFQDHKIEVSCKRRNLSSVTPMFVKSFASQIMTSGTFSQSVDDNVTAAHSYFSHDAARPHAMQNLQFEPTLNKDVAAVTDATTTFSTLLDAEFDRATTAPNRSRQETTARDKRFPRFLTNKSEISKGMRNKYYQKNKQRTEMMNQENVRQRSSVKLNNNYRIGDYPDIEITHSSFIVPLQQLIKLDRLFCKHVTVFLLESLIQEIIERENSEDFRQAVVDKLRRILHNSCDRESSINAIILETFLNLKVTCDPRDIIKASKTNGLDVLGLFLLEHFLSNIWDDDSSPTSSKQMRVQDNYMENEKIDRWAQLASFYKSLNDVDVVLSIFRERPFLGEAVQEAALAEANGDWIRARDAFSRAYEQSRNSSIKEHCLQGLLETVNNLCDWSEIDRLVKSRSYNKNLGDLWDDAWKDWMIPYAFDAYVHMTAEGIWKNRDDLNIIQSWMRNPEKLEHLKSLIGEDLIIFLMRAEQGEATNLLNNLLDKAGEQWIRLNPLCTELGIRKLQKLQVMNDLDASLKPLRGTRKTYVDRMTALLNFWSTKVPKIQDNLVQWNKLAACRTYSSILLEYMCDEVWDDESLNEIRQRMRRMNFQLRLDIGDAALKQKHRYIAEKHLTYLKGICNLGEELPLKWFEARTEYVVADVETDVNKKIAGYVASWERSHSLLNESGELNAGVSTAIREHIGAMASKLESLSREDEDFAHALMSKTAILQDIGIAEPTNVDPDDVKRQLLRYSLNNFRLRCEHAAATDVGEHYCALARHCYGRLTIAENDEMFREFLHSVLKSMNHSYFEATHYFPCLLRPERLQDEQTRKMFARECAELQPWLFLRWRDLLFSYLGTSSIADLVQPIVERLAEKYPDAIAYTYHHAVERNPEILDGRAQRIRSLLGDKAEQYKRILQAIQYVAQPILYLKYYVDELTKELSQENATMVESLWQRIYSIFDAQVMNKNKPRPGKSYGKELEKFVKTIKALDLNNRDAMQKELRKMLELIASMKKEKGKREEKLTGRRDELSNFSPFLLEFAGGDIEIPGQYSDDAEPVPRYHAKLAGFEPDVTVMPSLRKPIRISMIGDDGKKYKFLVKFGEDLTIDRGLQQLFATMNRTLRNDVSCRQRRLAVDTYEVIPLSRSCGLIQWIEDTKSLEDLIRTDNDRCKLIRDIYSKWIADTAPTKYRIPDQYKEAVSKHSQQEVTKKMEFLIAKTKQTALRQAFVTVSSSSECFVTLRRNFIASYATMCVAHWLAGVGDRHLQNILVRATGRCLGIDFGHAFGAGIRAPIPELVPFRLTPQILKLLQPFTERDLLATIMTHAMRALRNDRGPILACMDIFIHKPVDRSAMINDDEDNAEDTDADSTWSFRKNIEIVAQKLNGIHPSFITLEQLKEAHDNEYFTRYQAIVFGRDGPKQARADIKNNCLTPAQQVDCLLDQAKDLNILGRMYVNWQPWL